MRLSQGGGGSQMHQHGKHNNRGSFINYNLFKSDYKAGIYKFNEKFKNVQL